MQLICVLCAAVIWFQFVLMAAEEMSVASYKSIQEALNANPNRMLFVPAGDYHVTNKIRIKGEYSGLFGPGRIIQNSPNEPIIEIENARHAQVRDLTLTRAEGKMETGTEGILGIESDDLLIDNVRVLDNRTSSGAIVLRQCHSSRISRCLVRNYMRISVDDRTQSKEWGYAFNCTDGNGISIVDSAGVSVEGNRIMELNLLPTRELKEKYRLGEWSKKNAEKGTLLSQPTWDAAYSENWQQGSGIVVTGPTRSEFIRISGNHIENAAQGIDLHCDRVNVADNTVIDSFIGMKAMHGSRNVLITGNQFVKNTLWAIGLMPGAASHAGETGNPGSANTDGGSIVAHNIISDFGQGHASWVWGDKRSPFKFDRGQQPDDPPLRQVLITGNVLHNSGEPRYRYAVVIEEGSPTSPRELHFINNLLPAGTSGVANVALPQ
ncbi:MAG: hypothetical protein ACO1QB_13445 [Verrucomicrobiales bacterium]